MLLLIILMITRVSETKTNTMQGKPGSDARLEAFPPERQSLI